MGDPMTQVGKNRQNVKKSMKFGNYLIFYFLWS